MEEHSPVRHQGRPVLRSKLMGFGQITGAYVGETRKVDIVDSPSVRASSAYSPTKNIAPLRKVSLVFRTDDKLSCSSCLAQQPIAEDHDPEQEVKMKLHRLREGMVTLSQDAGRQPSDVHDFRMFARRTNVNNPAQFAPHHCHIRPCLFRSRR